MDTARIWMESYHGWPHCVWMENDRLRLIVTTDVGPRIICLQTRIGENMFHQFPEEQGRTGTAEWRNYGGHRLWHSPQMGNRPNQPDNDPVQWGVSQNTLWLVAPLEGKTLVQKRMEITLFPDEPRVHVRHFIFNRSLWPVQLAPWALSVMHAGGVEVLPVPREDTLYMPSFAVSFWPWTQPDDPRFIWGKRYFLLRHDPQNTRWFKIGYRNTEGWGAYFYGNCMFVKTAMECPGKRYPDYGSTFETYADERFVELETLGALETVEPEAFTQHDETWFLTEGIAAPEGQEDIERRIEPVIQSLISRKR